MLSHKIRPEGLALIDFALDTSDFEWIEEIIDKYSIYKDDMKKCNNCGEYKPITNFKIKQGKKRSGSCKKCIKNRRRERLNLGSELY